MVTGTAAPRARDALLLAAKEELVQKGHAAVSLRAVARRAGLSHAAPAHFFGSRAGMLTAVATEGFRSLAEALHSAADDAADAGEPALEALGLGYIEFGLAHPALMDLMFRRSELDAGDAGLIGAQRAAIGHLRAALAAVVGSDSEEWALVSWAFVHGLVSLLREGALAEVAERNPDEVRALARRLVVIFGGGLSADAR